MKKMLTEFERLTVENWCNMHEGFIRYLYSIKLKQNAKLTPKLLKVLFNNYSYDITKLDFTLEQFIEYWYSQVRS